MQEMYLATLNELSEAYEKAELLEDNKKMLEISLLMEKTIEDNKEYTNEYRLQ